MANPEISWEFPEHLIILSNYKVTVKQLWA